MRSTPGDCRDRVTGTGDAPLVLTADGQRSLQAPVDDPSQSVAQYHARVLVDVGAQSRDRAGSRWRTLLPEQRIGGGNDFPARRDVRIACPFGSGR